MGKTIRRAVAAICLAAAMLVALPVVAFADDLSQGTFTDFSVITEDGTETGYAGLFDARSAWYANEGSTLKLYKDWGNLQFGLNCSGYRTIDLNGHWAAVAGSAYSKCDGLIIKNGTFFINGCKFQNDAGGTVVFENATLDASPGSEIINNGIFVLGQGAVRTDLGKQFFYYNDPVQGLGDVTLDTTEYAYDGTEHEPGVTVKNLLNGDTLTEDTDYTVAYQNNVNAGTAKVIVTGIGAYGGPAFATFTINPGTVTGVSLADSDATLAYNGKEHKPGLTVAGAMGQAGQEVPTLLQEGTDYEVMYQDNVNVGSATATVTGKGNYTGTQTVNFNIDPAVIASIALSGNSFTYTGKAIEPAVTMKDENGNEFEPQRGCTVGYENNVNVGTATANVQFGGNFTGVPLSKEFQINPAKIASVELAEISFVCDGKAKTPAVTVKDAAGNVLEDGVDYDVAYQDNVNAGTATATVTGKGNYTGTKKASFQIKAKPVGIASAKLAKTSFTYTGKALTPAVAVKGADGKTLKAGRDYTAAYSANKSVGKAKVTVKGKGGYAGAKTMTFSINPKGTSLGKVKAGKKSFKASWKKQSAKMASARIGGYQLRYSTSTSMKGAKTATAKGYKAASKTVKKLKAKKRYYVQVRTYLKTGGKTYYSAWSKAKSVKTK